jgi:hypothetical protein
MANSLTNKGEEYALFGDGASDGAIGRLGTKIKLYTSGSTPNKDGTGFTEVANGNGYTTGGNAITIANWTYAVVSTNGRITLADQVWTASGGNIVNIAGAMLTNAADAVLGWWERSTPTTLTPGDSITLDDLYIELA